MASYYYLVAQLPYLAYGLPSPMETRKFRELCAELMDPGDAAFLSRCSLDPAIAGGDPTHSPLIDGWAAWERSLRIHLAKYRAARLKREDVVLPDAPFEPLDAAQAARSALALDSPLEAEQQLDRSRWAAIEALASGPYFSRDTVYAYLLKLLILDRKALFRVEEGFAEYKAIYASVMEAAPTSNSSGEPK
ncbi:MAG: hypothetical protein A2Z99_05085 [Treponema sp. GWB1_62_6]|nr:MAG: hypothetical protein A2Y36_12585 [Treponema sp. GWA1_62_8]OHE62594.1 MAG: hypothetical protein A2Z99_05085 [Treponema sp. GWB1_62_6]OHE63774.1 MAG: hypothetical protein A2001_00985 [Treponema sp. GWC1_61_84]OHE68702.1 MAG: hypothetical protein A2413_09425 [Treponema sp. RIFOXYC1_FULL_61_9]HCM27984.1 hypothetical protein [Treponema sp.]